jgi:hypothetical protein
VWLGLDDRDIQKDVAVHGEQKAVGVCADVRGGHSQGARGKLRLPHGVHHAGLHCAAGLQPHPNWWPARLQRLRNRHTHG